MASPKSVAMTSPRRGIAGLGGRHNQVIDAVVQCDLERRAWDCSQGSVRPATTVPAVRLMREWGGQAIGENIDAQTNNVESAQISRCDAGHSDMVVADVMRKLNVQPFASGRPTSPPRETLTAAVERILPDQQIGTNHFARADSRSNSVRAWGNNIILYDQLPSVNQSARTTSRGSSRSRPWSQNRTELAPVLNGHEIPAASNGELLPMATSHVRRTCDPTFRKMQAADQAKSITSRGSSCGCQTHRNSTQRRETRSLGPTAWAQTPPADVKRIRRRGPRPAFTENIQSRQTFQTTTANQRWPYPFEDLVSKRPARTRPMWWLMGESNEAAVESVPDEPWDSSSDMPSLFALPQFLAEPESDERRVASSEATMPAEGHTYVNVERAFAIYTGSA